MPAWRDDKILELANQLTYSPAEKRQEQMQSAIELLPGIDPAKSYPWDFVHYRITSFQPRTHIDHVVAGKVLRADLASLIEFLADTLSIRIEDAAARGEVVLAFDEVTRKFNVSSKTIQRWRKQGLIALRYLYPDGRRRLGFLESAVRQFAVDNKQRVERSSQFTQLTDEEKARIIELAHRLAAHRPGHIKDVARRIARQLGRSPETVRYTIRRHDREHPEAAVYPDPALGHDLRSGASQGPSPAETAPAPIMGEMCEEGQPPAAQVPAAEEVGLIEYIANPLFEHPDAENIIMTVLPAEALARAQASVSAGTNARTTDVYMARMPRDLPAFLQDIFRQPVMPQELETDAFRRMNYLKYKAAARQSRGAGEAGKEALRAEVDGLLAQAARLKNQILQANLRVAVHVARKHQRIDRPLMELLSDATIWLMRAIDKYDFSRPARFSTYAGYAIMKNFARDRAEQLTRRDTRMVTGQEELLSAIGAPQAPGETPGEQLDQAALQSDLRSVIEELPSRERELLRNHYGLDRDKAPLSLAQIGDQMGITKARVRQLEARALRNLRHLMEARREKLRRASSRPR